MATTLELMQAHDRADADAAIEYMVDAYLMVASACAATGHSWQLPVPMCSRTLMRMKDFDRQEAERYLG